jgi:hypothetical protein
LRRWDLCKHCENLVEDKETVHSFMELTARRLAEKHPGVTADDIDIEIHVNVTEWKHNPLSLSKSGLRIRRALEEMNK